MTLPTPEPNRPTVSMPLRVSPELKADLQEIARSEGTSLNSLCEALLLGGALQLRKEIEENRR